MKYSIEHTDGGWNLVGADDAVVATFTGSEEIAYHDAIAERDRLIRRHAATLVLRTRPSDPARTGRRAERDRELLAGAVDDEPKDTSSSKEPKR